MQPRFLYRAHGLAAAGHLTSPHKEPIEIQAANALPSEGGHGVVRVENFRHRDVVSFASAHTQVTGVESTKDGKTFHHTLVSTTIEKLNILNIVTADTVVARITSKHPKESEDEPSIIPLGSTFVNLRIAGRRVEVDFDDRFCEELDTHGKALPHYSDQKNGMIGTSLVKGLDRHPGGERRAPHIIHLPEFGTIHLGEFLITPHSRRLIMLRIEFGCSVCGKVTIAEAYANGTPYPPPPNTK